MIASMKPRRSITRASSVYITPIRLWSTLVIHSRHRYGRWPLSTTQTTTAIANEKHTQPATTGIGGSHGTAFQVGLPNISLGSRGPNRGTAGPAGGARPGRDLPGHDGLEQARLDAAVGERAHVLALLHERDVAAAVQGGFGRAR